MRDKERLIAFINFLLGPVAYFVGGLEGLLIVLIGSLLFLNSVRGYEWWARRWERLAMSMSHELITESYLTWQQEAIEVLYKDLEIVSLCGKRYSAALLRHAGVVSYPFTDLCNLESTKMNPISPNKKQKDYLKLVEKNLHTPEAKGFSMYRVNYDLNGCTRAGLKNTSA